MPESIALRIRAEDLTKRWLQGSDRQTPGQVTAKLTLPLPHAHADALVWNAGALGLSCGEHVSRLVGGNRLPRHGARSKADHADRVALLASNAPLATRRPISWRSPPWLANRRWSRQGLAGIVSTPPTPRSTATSIRLRR